MLQGAMPENQTVQSADCRGSSMGPCSRPDRAGGQHGADSRQQRHLNKRRCGKDQHNLVDTGNRINEGGGQVACASAECKLTLE